MLTWNTTVVLELPSLVSVYRRLLSVRHYSASGLEDYGQTWLLLPDSRRITNYQILNPIV